eukprot:CAMPEP_0119210750 /NCGR_PEP_ID=MMETSP1327-20130426/2482_1 /TAXON_ID=38833 /ORGANISM="Micromonas pusilla, Strain RCC2306" /LENGTH=143 /DNA_ID=CAMNT_0007207819 /DNA_START=112 /DNA_END=543 /DNA_ORIENTATION=-
MTGRTFPAMRNTAVSMCVYAAKFKLDTSCALVTTKCLPKFLSVKGTFAERGAANELLIPGTSSYGTLCLFKAAISSRTRENTDGHPPLSRHVVLPAMLSFTSTSFMSPCRQLPKSPPRFPTNTSSHDGLTWFKISPQFDPRSS